MKCLLLIDIQNGFCSGGNLAVPNGEDIVPIANRLIAQGKYDLVVASKDWHPADHGSFASQHPGSKPFDMGTLKGAPQMLWPDHCVQDTLDAQFHPGLNVAGIDHVQRKGENRDVDSYSAFRDNDQSALTGLSDYLKRAGIGTLDICGLATDYCVKASALDAKMLLPAVSVRFIADASRGIDAHGVEAAMKEMAAAGVRIMTCNDVFAGE